MTTDDRARATLARWKIHPLQFVRECLGAEPDAWQAEALEAFPRVKRLAMKACKGPGKTTVLAWCALNFLLTRPHANIAATSISGDNLRDGLMKELAVWIGRSPILTATFIWQAQRIVSRTEPSTWWLSARQWSKSADTQEQSQTLAGLHSDHVLFVLDEVGSIPQAVTVTAEAVLATGSDAHVIIAGNPTSLEGALYRACNEDRRLWHVIEITGDPDNPDRSPRIDLQWARDEIKRWGRDNSWVQVNVLGQFPPSSLNALLGIEEVTAAMRRHLVSTQYEFSQKRLGVDVARFGDDYTVIFPRQGRAAFRPFAKRHARNSAASVDIATWIIRAKTQWGSEQEFIDATGGWAAGARDVLLDGGYPIHEVQFHAPAMDPRYENRRAEMWLTMAKWIQDGGALPNVPELVPELTTPTYIFRKGKLMLEDKEHVKEKLGRSPNYADALATTFALPEMPAKLVAQLRGSAHVAHDGDPWKMPQEER